MNGELRRVADVATIVGVIVGVPVGIMSVMCGLVSFLASGGDVALALGLFRDFLRAWWLQGLVAAAVVGIVMAWLWPGSRRLMLRGLGRIGEWLKERYVRMLWRLVVRPARDRFGVEAWQHADGLGLSLVDLVQPKLRHLDSDDLTLLARVLSRREPGSREVFVWWPSVRLEPPAPGKPEAKRRFGDALENLRAAGFVTRWVMYEGEDRRDLEFKIRFPIAGSGALERLYVVVEAELATRAAREGMGGTEPVLEPVLPSEEEKACRAAIGELSAVSADVLHRVLEEYDRWPGDVVRIDAKEHPLWVASHADHDDEAFSRALGDLAKAGFLRSVSEVTDDQGEAVQLVVAECLEARSVAREVTKWVVEEMTDRGVWGSAS